MTIDSEDMIKDLNDTADRISYKEKAFENWVRNDVYPDLNKENPFPNGSYLKFGFDIRALKLQIVESIKDSFYMKGIKFLLANDCRAKFTIAILFGIMFAMILFFPQEKTGVSLFELLVGTFK